MDGLQLRAWLTYYTETETFDRTLPGRWMERQPDVWEVAPWERGRSVRNSFRVRDLIQDGMRGDTMRNGPERDYAMRLSHDDAVRMLGEMGGPLRPEPISLKPGARW